MTQSYHGKFSRVPKTVQADKLPKQCSLTLVGDPVLSWQTQLSETRSLRQSPFVWPMQPTSCQREAEVNLAPKVTFQLSDKNLCLSDRGLAEDSAPMILRRREPAGSAIGVLEFSLAKRRRAGLRIGRHGGRKKIRAKVGVS